MQKEKISCAYFLKGDLVFFLATSESSAFSIKKKVALYFSTFCFSLE